MYGLTGTQIWGGYPASYQEALNIVARAEKFDPAQVSAMMQAQADARGQQQEVLPRLYSRIGNVGVITMSGSMINFEDPMMAYMGVTTYPAIQEAAAFAAQDAKVSSVLLDINSGGGSVSGVETTANMLAQLKQVKPITTFSDGVMGSAAYWLGSMADKMYANASTIVGSIGTVAVHAEQSKALADAGIKMTVIRSGEYKALGHSAEPLSPLAHAQIQDMVDKSSTIFENAVAANLGMSLPALQKISQGKEYLGADALAVGLIHGLSDLNNVLSKMQSKPVVDKTSNTYNNQSQTIRGYSMARTVLTNEQVVLAIAAGADEAALLLANADAKKAFEAGMTADELLVVKTKEAEDHAAQESAAVTEATAVAVTLAADVGKPVLNVEVDFLKAQVTAANLEIMNLRVTAQSADNKFKADAVAMTALCKIAAASINNMNVSLRGCATNLDSLSAEALVARHQEVTATFTKEFKIGGVAATTIDEKSTVKTKAAVSSLEQARVKAAQIGGKK